eukprot:jgi/Ulvmu1/9386/UM051_0013.1
MKVRYVLKDTDMEDVRSQLPEDISCYVNDSMLCRFIRAERGNLKSVVARLHETVQWRRTERPETIVCDMCLKAPDSHYFHPVGFSKGQHPVMYSCSGMVTDRSPEGNRKHMIMTFEQTIAVMPEGVEKWMWFADFEGFGYRDLGVGVAKAFVDLGTKHYPERMQKFWIVGAPAIFSVLWNAIIPFVDEITKSKIVMLPYDVNKPDSVLKAEMEEDLDPECVTWLLQEMAENRQKGIKKTKRYCQKQLTQAITAQDAKTELKRHWGSHPMLNKLLENPAVLEAVASSMRASDGVSVPNRVATVES